MKRIVLLITACLAVSANAAFASEGGGVISTGVSTGLEMSLPCNPASVTNGTVNPQTCVITCNSGYTLSALTCVAASGGGGGGGGGGGTYTSVFETGSTASGSTATGSIGGGGTSSGSTSSGSTAGSGGIEAIIPAFTDIGGSWARDYIITLVKKKIVMNGLFFRPDDSLTRAEFLKMVGNSAGWDLNSTAAVRIPFGDVSKTQWYAAFVRYAVAKGIIRSSSTFRPNDQISRAEVAKILAVSLGLETKTYQGIFSDVPKESGLAIYVEALKRAGIIGGQTVEWKLIFRPNDSITRAEIAKVLVLAFKL